MFDSIDEGQLFQRARELRRHLHQYPELSGEERETAELVSRVLVDAGLEVTTGIGGYGVLGVLKGKQTSPVIALRADMDALPITEATGADFASTKQGVMHACGHDAHTAMLLTAAEELAKYKEEIDGTVLFVFQPAEEDAPVGGAAKMLEEGVFQMYPPDAVFAQHVWPDLPVGTFGVQSGPVMGNSDRFRIVINGAGGHASMPHQGVDAIVAATQITQALQTIVSRNTDPQDAAVITVGKLEAGERYNVIPREAVLEGTVRTLDDEVKENVKARFHQVVTSTAEALGTEASINYMDGYPATVNDPEFTDVIKNAITHSYGQEALPDVRPSLGGEDFGRFLQHYPGVYYWLGITDPSVKKPKPLHDPSFHIEEEALLYGVKQFMHTVEWSLDALQRKGENV
ncbi:M20 metallopeptidase family protein [Salsuginibacillus halophilus]|nr:M20 family metallopeptidase [Salsuginibacillus halophilus]